MTSLPIIPTQHSFAMSRGAKCNQCALYDGHLGPVPSQVRPGCLLAIGGEAPGTDEVEGHENFIGFSGRTINQTLEASGLPRHTVTIINTIACQPPDEQSLNDFEKRAIRKAKRATAAVGEPQSANLPTEACSDRFALDLDEAVPKVYLAVGKFALEAFEKYLRSRYMYDGDSLVMAQMHGSPVVLATPREAYDRAVAAINNLSGALAADTATIIRLQAIANVHARAAQYHGADTTRYLFSSYHPAFAAAGRSPKWMTTIEMNLRRAMTVAVRGWIDWAEPNYVIAPSPADAIKWLDWASTTNWERVTDLETCRTELPPHELAGKPSKDQHECAIRTIGVALQDPNNPDPVHSWHVLVVPFRHMNGSFWEYNETERAAIAQAFRRLFSTGPILAHNGVPFDSEIMLRTMESTLSIPSYLSGHLSLLDDRKRLLADPRILHHNTPAQDMPHTLSFVTREFYEVINWKSKEDITSTDNANDHKLMLRCGRDTYTAGLIASPLRQRIEAFDTTAQNATDHRVGLILRDMSELGMCIDEPARGELSEVLNRECDAKLKVWNELVGKEVNPRSVQQMQTLLFEDWGIEPPLSTENDVYDPDRDDEPFEPDEAATSAEALLMIIDRAKDHGIFGNVSSNAEAQRRLEALETLLEYKALDKPRGSYCDSVPVRKWNGPSLGRAVAQGMLAERDAMSLVRATWSIPNTPVGRSGCKDPGLQQVPALGREILLPDGTKFYVNMRRPYVAPPGHILVAADYAQSHVRIFYAVANDQVGYETLARGLKPHHFHAAGLIADHPSKVMDVYHALLKMPGDQQEYWKLVAKKFVFATIYNPRVIHIGSPIQAYHTNYRVMKKERKKIDGKRAFPFLKLEECEAWEDRWYNAHPATEPWQIEELRKYEQRKFAMSEILDMRKRAGPLDPTAIGNHAILAFEGSLKNKAMIEVSERIPHRGWSEWSGLVGDFHDSLMVQVPEERAMEAGRILKEAMTYHWRGMEFTADPKAGKSWGSMKDIKLQ